MRNKMIEITLIAQKLLSKIIFLFLNVILRVVEPKHLVEK